MVARQRWLWLVAILFLFAGGALLAVGAATAPAPSKAPSKAKPGEAPTPSSPASAAAIERRLGRLETLSEERAEQLRNVAKDAAETKAGVSRLENQFKMLQRTDELVRDGQSEIQDSLNALHRLIRKLHHEGGELPPSAVPPAKSPSSTR